MGGARPHIFLCGRQSNPRPGYSQLDRLPLYLMTSHYLKGSFSEKWQERLMGLIKPHRTDYKETIWVMCKTGKTKNEPKQIKTNLGLFESCKGLQDKYFKIQIPDKNNPVSKWSNLALTQSWKCDCVVSFLIASKHLIFFPLLWGSQASKASLLLTSNYQGRWENSHHPQGECPHFVLLETSLAMRKILLLKKLSAFSIAPPFPES